MFSGWCLLHWLTKIGSPTTWPTLLPPGQVVASQLADVRCRFWQRCGACCRVGVVQGMKLQFQFPYNYMIVNMPSMSNMDNPNCREIIWDTTLPSVACGEEVFSTKTCPPNAAERTSMAHLFGAWQRWREIYYRCLLAQNEVDQS